MAKKVVRLTFPEQLVRHPVTFRMAKQFDIIPNILRARVSEAAGEMVLELEGSEENLERGVQYLREQGVEVTAIQGDIVE